MTGQSRTVKTGYRQNTRYITEGNTVRVVRTEVDPFYEREVRRKIAMESLRQKEKEAARSANRRKSVSIAFPVLVMMAVCLTSIVYLGYQYLSLRSSVDTRMNNVHSLETQLEKLRTENDALEQSIEKNVDLTYVYNVATGKLGMVRADAENIITFDKTESQYVRQYEQIPQF